MKQRFDDQRKPCDLLNKPTNPTQFRKKGMAFSSVFHFQVSRRKSSVKIPRISFESCLVLSGGGRFAVGAVPSFNRTFQFQHTTNSLKIVTSGLLKKFSSCHP